MPIESKQYVLSQYLVEIKGKHVFINTERLKEDLEGESTNLLRD